MIMRTLSFRAGCSAAETGMANATMKRERRNRMQRILTACERRLKFFPLPCGRDVQNLPVFRDGSAREFDALVFQLDDDLIIVERIELVFFGDDGLEFFLHR